MCMFEVHFPAYADFQVYYFIYVFYYSAVATTKPCIVLLYPNSSKCLVIYNRINNHSLVQ